MHPIHNVHEGKFQTFTGKTIDIHNPKVDMIDIEDIAHALSNICRFGGHSRHFYSVAQHSIYVATLAPGKLMSEALLHDAAEAYLGDVIKPLKVILGVHYAEIEYRFEDIIRDKFDLDPLNLSEVKRYDLLALEYEHEWLQKANNAHMKVHGLAPFAWTAPYAKEMFLNYFQIYHVNNGKRH